MPYFLGDNDCLPPCDLVLLALEIRGPCHPAVHLASVALDAPLLGGADFAPSLGLHREDAGQLHPRNIKHSKLLSHPSAGQLALETSY